MRRPPPGWSTQASPSEPNSERVTFDVRFRTGKPLEDNRARAQLMFLIEISMLTVSGMGILVTERRAVWSLAVEMSISSRRLWMRISQWS